MLLLLCRRRRCWLRRRSGGRSCSCHRELFPLRRSRRTRLLLLLLSWCRSRGSSSGHRLLLLLLLTSIRCWWRLRLFWRRRRRLRPRVEVGPVQRPRVAQPLLTLPLLAPPLLLPPDACRLHVLVQLALELLLGRVVRGNRAAVRRRQVVLLASVDLRRRHGPALVVVAPGRRAPPTATTSAARAWRASSSNSVVVVASSSELRLSLALRLPQLLRLALCGLAVPDHVARGLEPAEHGPGDAVAAVPPDLEHSHARPLLARRAARAPGAGRGRRRAWRAVAEDLGLAVRQQERDPHVDRREVCHLSALLLIG